MNLESMRRVYRAHFRRFWFARSLRAVFVAILGSLRRLSPGIIGRPRTGVANVRVCRLVSIGDFIASRARFRAEIFPATKVWIPRPIAFPQEKLSVSGKGIDVDFPATQATIVK